MLLFKKVTPPHFAIFITNVWKYKQKLRKVQQCVHMTHLGNSIGRIRNQAWSSLRPTALIHHDSVWKQRRHILISPRESCHVMPGKISFKSNYEWSYLLEYCTIENKILPPKISHCLESQIFQPDFHYMCSVYLDHSLKYHGISFTYLDFGSGANNLPKDRFLGKKVSFTCSQISRLGSYS